MKSPGGREVSLPTSALSHAIAGEWAAQEGEIDPRAMPLTQLAFTGCDRVGPERAAVAEIIAKYGETDMLCYWADGPADLVAEQERLWRPLLDWARDVLGAPLEVTTGIVHAAQDEDAVARLRAAVEACDDATLTVLAQVTQVTGSLILGLGLIKGRLAAEAVIEAAELDERFQEARWGEDDEARARRQALAGEIKTAALFLDLLTAEAP